MRQGREGSHRPPTADAGRGFEPAQWPAGLDALPAALYVARPGGACVWVSPSIEKVAGRTQAEWLAPGARWVDRVHPDDRERVAGEWSSRTEGPLSTVYRLSAPADGERWVRDLSVIGKSASTTEPQVFGVLIDVTEEQLTQRSAAQLGQLFRALVEHAREAVTIVDAQGVVVYQNPSMGRVVGRPPEWFAGKTPLDLMPPEDAARGREILGRLMGKPGAQLPGEFRLAHRDGSWRVVSGVATNLLHDPAVRGIVLNYRDVTEERRIEQSARDEQQRRQTLLEGIISAETQQSSRIAGELHDDTIQIMTASLVELDRVDRHLREGDVDAARAVIARARTALLEATDRTRRLTFELRPQLLEAAGLGPAVRDLASALRKDTDATVKVRTRVGRYPIDIETLAYRTIREVLINVRKHARAETVWINVTERRGCLAATIRDDGRGFSSRRRRSITSPHIGLETAAQRIRAMGGRFDVTSQVGAGTTVEIELPVPGLESGDDVDAGTLTA
jgi:PAS domain S-box-containing protein